MALKKVLIITYYWPPSGGGGVQRWLKFTRYLQDFNWEPIIYTPENPDFEIRDVSLLAELPAGVKTIKRPIWEPFAIYRKLLGKKAVQQQGVVTEAKSLMAKLSIWIRGNYFIPDSRVFWVRPSVNFLTKYLKANPVDAIVTTGPPHSLHLIGLEIKTRLKIKWLADFRDPWSKWDVLDQLNLTKRSRKSHNRLEKKVLTVADKILTVSPSLKSSLQKLGATSIEVITNGFDFDLASVPTKPPEKFMISHIGLLNSGRNPKNLWLALNELCNEVSGFADDLQIYLAGTIESEVIQSVMDYKMLESRLVNNGYKEHEEVIQIYLNSAILLLLINDTDNAKWILPGKMFEYLAFSKPILALGMSESDASTILQEAGHGPCVSYQDQQQIKAFVLNAYNDFKNGSAQPMNTKVNHFHRRTLTKSLATCLDNL